MALLCACAFTDARRASISLSSLPSLSVQACSTYMSARYADMMANRVRTYREQYSWEYYHARLEVMSFILT